MSTSLHYDANEMLDLVNSQDAVVGTVTRKQFDDDYENGNDFIRAAMALIQNKKGQLWIPLRNLSKKLLPGGMDFSVAEHVSSGESYDQAVVRGFDEELNMKISLGDLKYLGKLPPVPKVPYFSSVYLYYSETVPEYNSDDYSGFDWLYPNEIITRIENGETAKDALVPVLKIFF